jgi:hypothetical protein
MNTYFKYFLISIPFIIIVAFLIAYIIPFNAYYLQINAFLKTNILKEIKDNEDILDVPLYRIMINSSHNTYLNGVQHVFSPASFEGVKFALDAGARVIELDINHLNGKPVVAHGNTDVITTLPMNLYTMVDDINNHYKSSDPLFITLEIPDIDNSHINKQIVSTFKNVFGNRLLLPQTDVDYTQLPLRNFLNKIILVIGSVDKDGILTEVVHSSNHFRNYDDDNKTLKIITKDTPYVVRVYAHPSIGSIFSENIDPIPFRKNYINWIALNFQTRDKYLFDNLKFFKEYSFVNRTGV